jgi:hypothetical protein
MQAVGDQGGRTDPPAHHDPVAGDHLVTGETDDRGRGHPSQVIDRLRVHQPLGSEHVHRLDRLSLCRPVCPSFLGKAVFGFVKTVT